MYLDLNNTLLHLICKITKANGTNIEADAKVAPIAYPFATMFNQGDINLGDQLVTQNDNIHKALDTQLSAGLFDKDTQAHFEDTTFDGGNNSFKKRASFTAGSRQFDLLGCIHSDLFFQDKLLVNGIDLKIKLNCNKDALCLISGDAKQNKLVILSTSLFVKRVKVSPSVRLAHAEALHLSNANNAMERVALKIFSIPASTKLTQQQNLFLGQFPKLIIIGFVDNTAFSRLYASNPFNFEHYNINYGALVHEGAVIPAKPFTRVLEHPILSGKHLRDSGVVVSREVYGAGYTLFAFDLTPDMEDGDHYNLIKNGTLKAEICFTQVLATNVNMVVFSVFDSVIQVNHSRQIMFDYH
ncbi:uncharacterized protein F54H12.2-like [Pleurodeles waltl]|uniref:uncharacterized protein F54H12.2-like n=1 Tax=Pleurodeles waltl TaxID=8319 RepID=UPI003709BD56